jgi:hypothetical protein
MLLIGQERSTPNAALPVESRREAIVPVATGLTLVEFQAPYNLATAAQGRPVLLTENLKSHNSFLWRQLAAPGPSPNTFFLPRQCPHGLC